MIVPSEPLPTPAQRELLAAAAAALGRAHAPYSRFAVGAAVRGADGSVFAGCNVENASYPEGWCAETSALAALVLAGQQPFSTAAVVVRGEVPCSPCGGCRQRLAELAADGAEVWLAALGLEQAPPSPAADGGFPAFVAIRRLALDDLLPERFSSHLLPPPEA